MSPSRSAAPELIRGNSPDAPRSDVDRTPPPDLKRLNPALVWAWIGLGFLGIALWSFGAWILSGDAYAVVPQGPDVIPRSTKVLAWVLQVGSAASGVGAIIYLVRRTRREGRLPFDASVAIGFVSCYWMDSLVNYYRPVVMFNSYLVNLGSWDEHIPGWIMPNGRELPTPLLFTGPMYVWAFMGSGMLACYVARRTHARWPTSGKARLFLVGLFSIGLIDLLLEVIFIRSGLYAYSAVVEPLSVFSGTTHQFPVYESVLVGAIGATVGMVRYGRDDRGRSSIEKGIEAVRLPPRGRNVVRTLSFIGFAQATFFAANVPFLFFNFYVAETPEFPSYMTNGMCGGRTGIPCPGPAVPVILPDNPRPVEVNDSGTSLGG